MDIEKKFGYNSKKCSRNKTTRNAYHPTRKTFGFVSFSRWAVGLFLSILTSKQTLPRVTPYEALAPAHMYPNPSSDMASAEQKSVGLIFRFRSELSAK